ncbi:hypothetical protein BJ508DRAFT_308866 [Ascobolus immersus RN42]|uniref:Uncharacterized protein n=1 Tax=Ascobolus immersus RN42 TaxID=1160509 RepID=A0A3N4IAP2_ASCIM|nr:hypothetical protein BJ508DRAFT_308866 [Ascobolus immersus RN42]
MSDNQVHLPGEIMNLTISQLDEHGENSDGFNLLEANKEMEETYGPCLFIRHYALQHFKMKLAEQKSRPGVRFDNKPFEDIVEDRNDWKLRDMKECLPILRLPRPPGAPTSERTPREKQRLCYLARRTTREFLFNPLVFFGVERPEEIGVKVRALLTGAYPETSDGRYKALVVLIGRLFSPPPVYLKKNYFVLEEETLLNKDPTENATESITNDPTENDTEILTKDPTENPAGNVSKDPTENVTENITENLTSRLTKDQRGWLAMAGALFELLREEMKPLNKLSKEELKESSELKKDLHKHLAWFAPHTYHLAGPFPPVLVTIMSMAFGCQFIPAQMAAEVAWIKFYGAKPQAGGLEDLLLTKHVQDKTFVISELHKFANLPMIAVRIPCNQKGTLSGVLRLLFEKAEVVRETKIKGEETGADLFRELCNRILPEVNLVSYDYFYQYPQKETGVTEAFRFLLRSGHLSKHTIYITSMREPPCPFQGLFFSVGPGRYSTEQKVNPLAPRRYFNGGESELLPTILDSIDIDLSAVLAREPHCSFLHHLIVYRAPATVMKILENLRRTCTSAPGSVFNPNHIDSHNISPPLTHIMRQAAESRIFLNWAFKFRNIALSIQHVIQAGGDPSLVDLTPELAGWNVNAFMFASLDRKLEPLLRALLAGKNALTTVEQASIDKWYDDCEFWKEKSPNKSKDEILEKLGEIVKKRGHQIPNLKRYTSEDYQVPANYPKLKSVFDSEGYFDYRKELIGAFKNDKEEYIRCAKAREIASYSRPDPEADFVYEGVGDKEMHNLPDSEWEWRVSYFAPDVKWKEVGFRT